MEHGRYYKATEVAKIYNFPVKRIRNLCHARGQKFAVRFVDNGMFYIDLDKFNEFLKRKQENTY